MTKGLTMVEILIGIALALLVLGAIVLLVGRGVNLSREHTEQERITEDARVQMERLSDAIRDAHETDENPTWLVEARDYDIEFYTNVDDDPDIERLRYFLEGTQLKRSLDGQVVVVANSLRNRAEGVPLFRYYTREGDIPLDTPVIGLESVGRVEITLVVDVNEAQAPPAATVSTMVVPRASE